MLQDQVDEFDHTCNTERPHQGLPGRVTPLTAWEATPKTEAPHPRPARPTFTRPAPRRPQPVPPQVASTLPADTHIKTLTSAGTFTLNKVTCLVGGQHAFAQVLVITDGDQIIVTNPHGEILIQHTRPTSGTTYVGNGMPPGPRPRTSETSPKP